MTKFLLGIYLSLEEKMKKIVLFALFVVSISYVFADCDMMAMIAKEGETISDQIASGSTFDDPTDYFNYLCERSNNRTTGIVEPYTGLYKVNPDGYGVVYYNNNDQLLNICSNYQDEGNNAYYLTDSGEYYTFDFIWSFNDNTAPLNFAYYRILNQYNNALVTYDYDDESAVTVLGHARKGTGGNGSHPFWMYDANFNDEVTYTFMHNGAINNTIKDDIEEFLILKGWFNGTYNGTVHSQNTTSATWVDSEMLFHYFMKFIMDHDGNVYAGINDALNQTNICGSDIQNEFKYPGRYSLTPPGNSSSIETYHEVINFVLSDGENLYVYRNSPSDGEYPDIWHELSYKEVNDDFYAVKTLSPENGTLIDQFDFVTIPRGGEPFEILDFPDCDIKTFSPGVTWISFPRLNQQYTYNSESYEQAYWNITLQTPGLLQSTLGGDPTINGFDIMHGNRILNANIDYEYPDFEDYGFDNMLFRHEGYKITVAVGADPTTLVVDGDRLLDTYTISEALPAYTENWIGYWLPESRNIVDAFGEFWEYVEEVWAEDWYYNKCSNNRGFEAEPVSWSTANKTLEYGKGYIVQFERTTQITGFHWTPSSTVEEPTKKAESENFTYTEEPDYEVIDVVEIPGNIAEIGVFQDDVCVGAVVVENECEQILVYSEIANREEIPFTFEIVTGNRELNQPVLNYLVYNENTGEFEKGDIIGGRQVNSIIKFNEIGEPENETPIIGSIQLQGNYPNPFNPATQISFSLPYEEEIELIIYNVKGQKVKTLFSGFAEEGTHSLTWNGENEAGRSVSSGIYFYELKTSSRELTRKMLMMK